MELVPKSTSTQSKSNKNEEPATYMYSAIANNSFSYILTVDEFRNELPEETRPSWIKITTITMVSSFIQDIDIKKLRNTLFVLWFLLVMIKMSAFVIVDVYINWQFSLMLIPVAALGHFVGLKVHDRVIENDYIFKRWMGGALVLICIVGLTKVLT